MKRKLWAVMLLALVLAAAGCGSGSAQTAQESGARQTGQSAESQEIKEEPETDESVQEPAAADPGQNEAGEPENSSSASAEAGEPNDSTSEQAESTEPASDTALQEFAADHLFASGLPEEELEKPSEILSSREDFIDALDYMAFYRIGEKVWFRIDPVYAQEIYNPYPEYQKAYEMADLADVYACQLDDSYYSELGVVGMKYSMSKDIASEAPETVTDTPVLPSFDYEPAAEPSEYPLTIENSDLPEISCENGEQLYYLAMNGYRPIPVPGSAAETLYEQAKEAVFSCTKGGQSDFEKIKGVYDWLTTEVVYDGETAYSSETYLVKEQAYYLEGVFLNHCAVCDGKAKACALMLNMLGIHCVRTTGVNEGGDHAWNMVQADGKWYILCATYGQANMGDSLGRIVPNYGMLLTGAETPYEWYPAQKHGDIEAQLERESCDIFEKMQETDGVKRKVSDIAELEELLAAAGQCGKEEYKVEFQYTGTEKDAFTEEMIALLEDAGNANAAEVRSDRGTVFEVMIMNG